MEAEERLRELIADRDKEIAELRAENEKLGKAMFDDVKIINDVCVERDVFKAENERLKAGGPPGAWHCDECNFFLGTTVIDVAGGRMGTPLVEEVPTCGNGCGLMRRETWMEYRKGVGATIKRLHEFCEEREAEADRLKEGIHEGEQQRHLILAQVATAASMCTGVLSPPPAVDSTADRLIKVEALLSSLVKAHR